jgi:hypothetical protein
MKKGKHVTSRQSGDQHFLWVNGGLDRPLADYVARPTQGLLFHRRSSPCGRGCTAHSENRRRPSASR